MQELVQEYKLQNSLEKLPLSIVMNNEERKT